VVTNNHFYSRAGIKALLILGLLLAGGTVWSKTVGVWKVAPMYVNDSMVNSLSNAGWTVVTVGNTNLIDGAVLESLDVLFVPGGWDVYRLAGFKARRHIVRFVAGGKGLFDAEVDAAKRPLFPQVGTTGWGVTNPRITASGTNELAAKLGERFLITNCACLNLNVGSKGKVLAVSGTVPVGVHGEVYGGRYVLLGFSPLGDTNNMENMVQPTVGAEEPEVALEKGPKAVPKLLPTLLDWLAAPPKLAAVDKSRQQALADLDFLRQERLGDWTQNRGGGGTQYEDLWIGHLSLVPEMNSRLRLPLKKRLFQLNDLSRSLRGGSHGRYCALTNEVQQTLEQLNRRYRELWTNTVARIQQMDYSELAQENPYVNAAGVLKRIEGAPGKSEAEKAAIMALVNRCVSDNPPVDASLTVAFYLHDQEISRQLLPAERLTGLLDRCDQAIADFRASIPAPVMAATVEERLRTDSLMMPYYTGNILPTPQKVDYKDEYFPMGKVAIVVGKDVVNPDPLIEVLTDRITRYGGKAAVVATPGAEHTAVVSLGDTELARQAQGLPAVPEKNEGYLIDTTRVGGKPVFILKGHDRLGLLWSIASLMQLIHWRDGQTLARAATVVDYPILQKRGLNLDGNDFFHPARNRAGQITSYPNTELRLQQNRLLILTAKINEPFYQSLIMADCYWHDWKHPEKMPADAHIEEDLAALGKSLTPLGVTWWAGIRPHDAGDIKSTPEEWSHKICADDESVEGLLYYARKAEEAGGHLSILMDDVRFPITQYDKERFGTAREVDTWVITRVMAQIKKEYPKARLLVCPPFYWGPLGYGWVIYGEDREEYLKMIGDKWPAEVEVFWSGMQVNTTTLAVKEHYDWWMGLTKRKPYFWQNCAAFWCHLYRRHYPTDPLDSLWASYWEGQFDLLGWYGFNGNVISRMSVPVAISGDFQWNPQAYSKDKQVSALRSVHEVAEKFIGPGSWPLLKNVTEPLSYFDNFECDERDKVAKTLMDQRAARIYDVLDAKRAAVYSSYKILQERFPVSLSVWTCLGDFIGTAGYADYIKANPQLRLFRSVVEQRAQAQKEGDFVAERDVFLPAVDFDGGWLREGSLDDLAKKNLQTVHVLDASKLQASISFPLTREQALASHEVLLKGRQNAAAGRLTLTLNGTTIFDDKAPFSKIESKTVHFPVPAGLVGETNNVLAISLAVEEVMPEAGGDSDDIEIGRGPPFAISYIVLKCQAGK